MRRIRIIILVGVIVATAITFKSCKKEMLETKAITPEESVSGVETNGKLLYEKIEKFCELNKAYKAGVKTESVMTLSEAKEIIELTTNYEHGEHMTVCEDVVLDTLYIGMPEVDANGNVMMSEVFETYAALENSLEAYQTVNNGVVCSYFEIKMPEIQSQNENIEVVFNIGEPSNDSIQEYPGPFVEGDDWFWGDTVGRCYDSIFFVDSNAAKELSKKFKYIPNPPGKDYILILNNVEHVSYTPYPDEIYLSKYTYYEDSNMESCSETWLFCVYGEYYPEPCIGYEEMNCYWRSIRRNITLSNAPLHYSPVYHSPYHECNIEDRHLFGFNEKRSVRVHTANVTYCGTSWYNPHSAE